METAFDKLVEAAQDQMGYFKTSQVDVERQYIHYHIESRRIEAVMRGIYRLTHFPPEEHEDLMVAYLWTDMEGSISHETALSLYGLSDLLPKKTHLTVPLAWKKKRRVIPRRFELHYADLESNEVQWHGPFPVTTLKHTFADLVEKGFDPSLFEQAIHQATEQGLVEDSFPIEVLQTLMLRRRP